MEKLGESKRDKFIEKVLDDLSDLNKNIALDKTLSYVPREKIEELFEQFDMLNSNIFNHKRVSNDSLNRLDNLSFIMAKIADLDFSYEAEVRELDNHLDHIAFSLNLMRDRLKEKLENYRLIESTLNSLHDIYIVTDYSGRIVYTNDQFKLLGIKKQYSFGMNIKEFIFSKLVVYGHSIDMVFDEKKHELEDGFIDNENSETVLRLTRKQINSEFSDEINFAYKIELLSKKFYTVRPKPEEDTNVIRTIYDLSKNTSQQLQDHKKILTRLKVALQNMNNDPLNDQLLENIDSMLKKDS